MKLKLSQLKPNPFKKNISNGELNREQVDKIKSNIKELGFFGSLPIFKKGNDYFLIAGHHRTQALKEVYGKDHEVEVVISDYNEDQIFKGMVIENITQRSNDFNELNENIVAIENYLNSKPEILISLRESRSQKGQMKGANVDFKDKATSSDISYWIDRKTEEVISHDVINQNLNIFHKLAPSLRKDVEKKHDKSKEERGEDNLNYSQAVILSGIKDEKGNPDHKEQKELAKVLNETREQRVREQGKLISQYKQAPEEIKEQIKEGKVDLADINFEVDKYNLEQSRKEKDKGIKIKSIKENIDTQINNLKYSLGDSKDNIAQAFRYMSIISKYFNDMNDEQKEKLDRELDKYEDIFKKVSDLISKLRERI